MQLGILMMLSVALITGVAFMWRLNRQPSKKKFEQRGSAAMSVGRFRSLQYELEQSCQNQIATDKTLENEQPARLSVQAKRIPTLELKLSLVKSESKQKGNELVRICSTDAEKTRQLQMQLQPQSQLQPAWPNQDRWWRCALRYHLLLLLILMPSYAQAINMGLIRMPQEDGGTTMVFFPTIASEKSVSQGPFRLSWAENSAPLEGNRRLIVVSHGSGGSPWVHADLARTLTQHGFVVAIPQHAGDNYLDFSEPGPPSWKRRPREVSLAIDRVSTNPLFAPLLRLEAVGVFGGSAGGHTALSFAGGEWSPARFRDHCMKYIADDFSSCVGFATLLRGTWLDNLKLSIAKLVIRWRFDDETSYSYTDKRVRAVVAMVPFAADFAPESLKTPQTSLGLIVAEKDINQVPRFHVKAIQSVCEPRCQILAQLSEAGHGAMLSPLPPFERGSIADHLLSDPPSFNREESVPKLNEVIARFFVRELAD